MPSALFKAKAVVNIFWMPADVNLDTRPSFP